MKKWKRNALIVGGVVLAGVIVLVSVKVSQRGVVTVQTGKVVRQDLTAVVTASGEVKPLTYVNINAQSFGKIIEILVKEGEHVKAGQVLVRLEAIQPAADVQAQRASVESSEAAVRSAQANLKTAQAELARSQADFQRAKFDWERAQGLFREQLIAQAEFDARRAAYESAAAAVELSDARVQQAKADLERARFQSQQARASLARASDVLLKTTYTAPIDGIVTNLPVHIGEQVVMGIQNSPGSFLMTVADMSIVTAEVKVDETDIVNVRPNQEAEVTIDAIPNKTFKGHVTEIGNSAIIRSTGLSTQQVTTGTQEARDFKVVVTLDSPPENLRPGLSATAKVTTATRKQAITVPIQALTIRQKAEIEEAEKQAGKKTSEGATLAASKPATETLDKKKKEELQGVFVVRDKRALFVTVETGITGVTDIEVTKGLKEGDEIITGSYKVLRTLKPNTRIKIDNKPVKRTEEEKT